MIVIELTNTNEKIIKIPELDMFFRRIQTSNVFKLHYVYSYEDPSLDDLSEGEKEFLEDLIIYLQLTNI